MVKENEISRTAYLVAKYILSLTSKFEYDEDKVKKYSSLYVQEKNGTKLLRLCKPPYPEDYLHEKEFKIMSELVSSYESQFKDKELKISTIASALCDIDHEVWAKSLFIRKALLNQISTDAVLNQGIEQIVYYGGEFSSYGLTTAEKFKDHGVRVFEGTLPAGHKFKSQTLVTSEYLTTLIFENKNFKTFECDLNKNRLSSYDFIDPNKKTLFVEEGLLSYLPLKTIKAMNEDESVFPTGSLKYFSFINKPNKKQFNALARLSLRGQSSEPYKTALSNKDACDLMRQYGYEPKSITTRINMAETVGINILDLKPGNELEFSYILAEYIGKEASMAKVGTPIPKLGSMQILTRAGMMSEPGHDQSL